MKNPKIKIKAKQSDYLLEFMAFITLVCLITIPIYYYNDLPQKLPSHFNLVGQPDSFSNRGIIWLLPITGLILYIGMTLLNKFPFAIAYPVKITNENAEKIYTIGIKSIRLLKVLILVSFYFINHRTIQIGLNKSTKLGKFYLPIFLFAIFILISIMIYKMNQSKTFTKQQ